MWSSSAVKCLSPRHAKNKQSGSLYRAHHIAATHFRQAILRMKQLKISKQITNRESQSLDRYLSEIGKVALVTMDEEVELAKRIREGDSVALAKLTRANLRFVVSVAK